MKKPTIIERFTDNGEHSHYELFKTETGELLWSENEAISFTEDKMKVVGGLLSEDYKTGYKEGIEHYLASKNDL